MRILDKLSDIINSLVEWIVAILMGAMTVVVFMQVVCRLTSGSLPWSEEIARYMMVYMVYLGASVGIKMQNHIAIEFVVGLLPSKPKAIAEIVANILISICLVVMVVFGMKVVKVTLMQKSPVLRLKMGYVYFALVASGALMQFQIIVNTLHSILDLLGKGAAPAAVENKEGGDK